MKVTPDRDPVNKDARKCLSTKSVPAKTIADALDIVAETIAGPITRQTIASVLARDLTAKYTLQIKKCRKSHGFNVSLNFQVVGHGASVAHFTELE